MERLIVDGMNVLGSRPDGWWHDRPAAMAGLTRRLEAGLLAQGHRLFTPAGNRSSILCFYTRQSAAEVRSVFDRARLDATIREGHVRLSLALFNTTDDVDRALEVTRRLV